MSLTVVSASEKSSRLLLTVAIAASLALGCHQETAPHDPVTPEVRPQIRFQESRVMVDEGVGRMRIPIVRADTRGTAWVELRVVGGSATRDLDYTLSDQVSFHEGDSLSWVTLDHLKDDVLENDENILLELAGCDSLHSLGENSGIEVVLVEDDYGGPNGPIRFPLEQGTSWRYRTFWREAGRSSSTEGLSETTAGVSGTIALNGVTLSGLAFSGRVLDKHFLRQEGQMILGAYARYTPPHDPLGLADLRYASLPWVLFDFAAPAGRSWVPFEVDSASYSERVEFHSGGRVRAAVPAGLFEDVAVIECTASGWAGDEVTGRSWEEHIKYWIADGIGIIRVIGNRRDSIPTVDSWSSRELNLMEWSGKPEP